MSESIDFDAIDDVLHGLGNIVKRTDVMGRAIASFDQGVELPPGVDLSGLSAALKALAGIQKQAITQHNSLVSTVKDALKADKSWGDHVVGWLTPPKTGLGPLDATLHLPASVAGGATDAGHDLGAGIIGLAADFNPVSNWHAYRNGDVMPIQRPGLGLWNIGAHPHDAGKAAVGWQYHDDPARMGTYAGVNILAMIATGGLGEAGEAGMSARLAALTEEGAVSAGRMSAEIDAAAARIERLGGRPRGKPQRTDWLMKKSSATRDFNRATERLAELQAEQAAKIAQIEKALDRLKALREHPVSRFVATAQTLFTSSIIKHLNASPTRWGTVAQHVNDTSWELSGLGNAGQEAKEHVEVRRRLTEISEAHAGGHRS